MEDNWLKD